MAPTTYADVLARNIRAARSRADLSQQTVAARMRALGYEAWLYQTLGNVEKGRRRVTAEEIFGLAYALETSISRLMAPLEDDKVVDFPSGAEIAVASAVKSTEGKNDGAVQWDAETPVFPAPLSTARQLAASGHGDYTVVSPKRGASGIDPATGEFKPEGDDQR
jgi:transcriptional regulator with XRE-family HTH domain